MDARTKARLEKLTKVIQDACDRVNANPRQAIMSVKVANDFRMVMVGHHDGHDYISVLIKDIRDIQLIKSCRIGANSGDDFFELKLVPSIGVLVAPLEDVDLENVFVPIQPIDIVGTFAPKEVQRIIRLINAI